MATGFMSDNYHTDENGNFATYDTSEKWQGDKLYLWEVENGKNLGVGYLSIHPRYEHRDGLNSHKIGYEISYVLSTESMSYYPSTFQLGMWKTKEMARNAALGAFIAWLKDQQAGAQAMLDSLI